MARLKAGDIVSLNSFGTISSRKWQNFQAEVVDTPQPGDRDVYLLPLSDRPDCSDKSFSPRTKFYWPYAYVNLVDSPNLSNVSTAHLLAEIKRRIDNA